METGSRSEIVRSVGFRFGSRTRSPLLQSMNSDESCSAQKARSAFSERNLGSFFELGIYLSFLVAHIAGRYHRMRFLWMVNATNSQRSCNVTPSA